MMTSPNKKSQHASTFFFMVTIIVIAINLRPAITVVGPLIESIRSDFAFSHGTAGLITTLPLMAFAIFSPLAPKIGRRFGIEIVLFGGMVLLTIGIVMRSLHLMTTLFIGTCLIGIAIAVCNVLLPALVKFKFPHKIGLFTGVYSAFMGLFAALGSGLSVPLAEGLGLGWRGSLACWSFLAVIAAVVWLPKFRSTGRTDDSQDEKFKLRKLWRSPLAWQVTFFMGLQSFVFYVTVAWLPEILHDKGFSVSTAGWMMSFMLLIGVPATFIMPLLADRRPDQRLLVVLISLSFIVGLVGILIGSTSWTIVWLIFLGLGLGASISLALAFLSLRARSSQQAAELSGMAQSIEYTLAAIGPVLFGYLHDMTHSWTVPLIMLLFIGVVMLIAGLGAGRNTYVSTD